MIGRMRERKERPQWKPWHIAALLAVIGVLGAFAVAIAARSIDSIDKRDVEAWEQYLLPQMTTVMGFHATLVDLGERASEGQAAADLDADLKRIRTGLQKLRRPLQEHRYAEITIPATGRYLTALGETFAALAIIENALAADDWIDKRLEFDAKIQAAREAYADGGRLRARLRSRAGLDRR